MSKLKLELAVSLFEKLEASINDEDCAEWSHVSKALQSISADIPLQSTLRELTNHLVTNKKAWITEGTDTESILRFLIFFGSHSHIARILLPKSLL